MSIEGIVNEIAAAPTTQANLTARLIAEIERLDRAEGRQ